MHKAIVKKQPSDLCFEFAEMSGSEIGHGGAGR